MSSFEHEFGHLAPITQGIAVSIILPASCLSGLFAGTVSDKLSRKHTISMGAAIMAVGSAIACGSKGPSLASLYVGRIVQGLGEGFVLGCATTYLTELSPKSIRGKTILLFQLFTTAAVATGFFVCYGSVKISSSLAWRLPFALQTISGIALAILAPLQPYSPRWLASKGRMDEANAVLDLTVGPADAADRKEMLAVPPNPFSSTKDAMLAIFQPGVRGRTLLGIFINVAQQTTGIDFVLYFSPLLFAAAGLPVETASFVASGVTGLILTACTLAGYFYIDRIGRRPLFITGGACVSACLFVLGAMYASGASGTAGGKWCVEEIKEPICDTALTIHVLHKTVIIFIELFAMTFAASWY